MASTRPGRVGLPVAEWFRHRAAEHGGFDLRVVDLADLALPLMDEPHHPRLRKYTQEHTRAWSAIVDASDAFVIVTPEYNHSFPATIKNAIDYLHGEWQHKPVGLVSYGGVSAGLRAAQALKPVLQSLKMITLVEAVTIPFVSTLLNDDGAIEPTEALDTSAKAMLDELVRIEATLRPLRTTR